MDSQTFTVPAKQWVPDLGVALVMLSVFVLPAAFSGPKVLLAVVCTLAFLAVLMGPPAWQVRLEGDSALVGLGRWGTRIPYERVVSLSANRRIGDRTTWELEQGQPSPSASYPLRIQRRRLFGTTTLWLRKQDAQAAVLRLRERCVHATTIDTDEVSYLPESAEDRLEGLHQLRRAWTRTGTMAVALAMICFLLSQWKLWSSLPAFSLAALPKWHTRADAWLLLGLSGGMFRFGIQALQRARTTAS